MAERIGPMISHALKQRKKSGGSSGPRSIEIPPSLMNMPEMDTDHKTRLLSQAIHTVLQNEGLVGEDSMFKLISDGGSVKGRLIRSYVAAMAMKKEEGEVRRLFMQMMLNTSIDNPTNHVNAMMRVLGDDPEAIKTAFTERAMMEFVNLDDSDFDSLLSDVI